MSYVPLRAAVLKLAVYGEALSVAMLVQVAPALSLYSNATVAMPEPPSVAVAARATVARSGVPGLVNDTVGAVLSIRRLVTAAEAVVFPALSVASARKS